MMPPLGRTAHQRRPARPAVHGKTCLFFLREPEPRGFNVASDSAFLSSYIPDCENDRHDRQIPKVVVHEELTADVDANRIAGRRSLDRSTTLHAEKDKQGANRKPGNE
jgi:hypothetical protein